MFLSKSYDPPPQKKRSSPIVEWFFRPKSDILQKKKVFTKIYVRSKSNKSTFQIQMTASTSKLLLPNPVGEAVFIFGAKISLKNTKHVLFCILFRPMGSDATLLLPILYVSGVNFLLKFKKFISVFTQQEYLKFESISSATN